MFVSLDQDLLPGANPTCKFETARLPSHDILTQLAEASFALYGRLSLRKKQPQRILQPSRHISWFFTWHGGLKNWLASPYTQNLFDGMCSLGGMDAQSSWKSLGFEV